MRKRVLVGVALAAALGLSGCGTTRSDTLTAESAPAAVDGDYTGLDAEGQALEALGMDSELVSFAALAPQAAPTPSPSASASAEPGKRRHKDRPFKRHRFPFGKRALHGEVVVQTDDGPKTLVAQRGTVSAVTDTSVTVKSADGYTLTWTFGDKLRVVERRAVLQPKDVAVGTEVGVSGAREGDQPVARFIVIPGPKPTRSPK